MFQQVTNLDKKTNTFSTFQNEVIKLHQRSSYLINFSSHLLICLSICWSNFLLFIYHLICWLIFWSVNLFLIFCHCCLFFDLLIYMKYSPNLKGFYLELNMSLVQLQHQLEPVHFQFVLCQLSFLSVSQQYLLTSWT